MVESDISRPLDAASRSSRPATLARTAGRHRSA